MSDYGIKISQKGFDVKTCDDKDLVMSSSFNMLKTKATGSHGSGSFSVAHGLAYIPVFFTTVVSAGKGSIIGDDPNSTCDVTNLNGVPIDSLRYYIFYHQGVG